jgi:iron complex outermembrane receptor protein
MAGLTNSALELSAHLVGRQNRFPLNADYADPPPGYSLVDVDYNSQLMLSGHLIRINLSIQNVFNTAYRDYLSRFRYFTDDPGRSIVARVQIPFGQFEQ